MADDDDERSAMLSEPDDELIVQNLVERLDALYLKASPVASPARKVFPALIAMEGKHQSLVDKEGEGSDTSSESSSDSSSDDEVGDRYAQRAVAQVNQNLVENGVQVGGIFDIFTKKGRSKRDLHKRNKKRLHAAAEAEAQKEKYEEKKQRHDAKYALESPILGAHLGSPKLASMPVHETVTFAGRDRKKKLIMKAVEDQTRLSGPAARLASHIVDFVKTAPTSSLDTIRRSFARPEAKDASTNYLGSLALAAALGKLRLHFEQEYKVDASTLAKLAQEFRAQTTVAPPMDAHSTTLFTDALRDYLPSVRLAVEKHPTPEQQESEAIRLGEHLAAGLIERLAPGKDTLSANHPAIALTSTCHQLCQTALCSATRNDAKFATTRLAAFWNSPLAPATWKQEIQKHFS